MKYIRNTGRYAIEFNIEVNGLSKKIIFDKRRIYTDTGNIATNGVTALEDDVYETVSKLKQFDALVKKGDFTLVDETASLTTLEAKDRKIAELEKKLAEAKAETKTGINDTEKEIEAKDEEIKSLKEQLEAKGKKSKKVSEGF